MLKVTEEIIEAIVKNQERIYGGAISPNWDIKNQVKENYSEKVAMANWQEIKRALSVNKKMKILDLGCGYGFFVAYLQKLGFKAFGCDVDAASVAITKKLLRVNHLDAKAVVRNTDFRLPYKSNTFDFVNLNYVLVYVKDLKAVFKEIYRVLKKDGQVYLITPNYQCCYDVNYGLFLIPWLPKWLNKLYLSTMGRKNLWFFDTFNFTTKRSLEGVFDKYNFRAENIGIKKWLEFLEKTNFTGRSQAYQKTILLIKRLHLEFVFKFLTNLGFYTPLIYVLRKND